MGHPWDQIAIIIVFAVALIVIIAALDRAGAFT
jgi:hypothetical protein